MKKTLAAVAVLGAFAGSALAADVQLYGIVDTGVGYNHVDMDSLDGVSLYNDGKAVYSFADSDSFSMMSGQAFTSKRKQTPTPKRPTKQQTLVGA